MINYIIITQPMKRTNTFTFFDDDKRTKFNDFNRINVLADSVDQMMKKLIVWKQSIMNY